jgi:hypothetical protein
MSDTTGSGGGPGGPDAEPDQRNGHGTTHVSQRSGAATSFRSWQVTAALAVVLLAVSVVIVLGLVRKANPVVAGGPLPVSTVDQPAATSAACRRLMPVLPAALGALTRRTLEGGGPGVAAWGDPPTILRCGLASPLELTCSSQLTQINGVSWLQLPTEPGLDVTTYIAADRSVRIALTVPDSAGSGPLALISDTVAATLPARPVCDNGTLLPTDVK